MIRIASAHYTNFRALRDVHVPFGTTTTVLVGPNNAGKTSMLEGIERALGLGRRAYAFDENDVSEGTDRAEGFTIRIEFAPAGGDRFKADEVALFGNHVDIVDAEHRLFVLIAGRPEEEEGVFRTRLRFAKSDGDDDGAVSAAERDALGFLLLPAVREARHEFAERGGLWSRLGAEVELTDEANEALQTIGTEGGLGVVEGLLGAERAADVAESITGLMSSVLFADQAGVSVDFSLLTSDIPQALRAVDVRLASPGLPSPRRIADQSVGTQSIAMFGLFDAYAKVTKGRVVAIGVEEPEAHLHPHAIRRVVRHLADLGAQTIVTTHSTAVTDAADPRMIVRLRRRGSETTAHAVAPGSLSEVEMRLIRKQIGEAGSDFVFARAVLLAEGQSERLAFPVLAAQLGYDLDVLGITVVPVLGNSFRSFAALLGENGLSIPFARLSDQDSARSLIKGAIDDGVLPDTVDPDDLTAAKAEAEAAGVFWWAAGDFEQVLLDAGGGSLYVTAIEELYGANSLKRFAVGRQVSMPAEPALDINFLRQALGGKMSKPLLAQRVAELFAEQNVLVPPELKTVIEFVVELARKEARLSVGQGTGP